MLTRRSTKLSARHSTTCTGSPSTYNQTLAMRPLQVVDLGRMRYADALQVQQAVVASRKEGRGVDTLLFVEHPHVVTLGRNAREQNVLASADILARSGIELHETNRGGDVTYHGP